MTSDELLARVRAAAEVPAYTYAGGDSGDDHTGWETLAARFAELDAWMCHHSEAPQEWRTGDTHLCTPERQSDG